MRTLTCLIAVLIVTPGCSNSGRPVVFVLPAGFQGEFRVVKDLVNGVELIERSGEWVFEIPPSGVLRVKDDHPFYRWHSERARYPDGRPVYIESVRSEAGYSASKGRSSTEYDGTTHIWRVNWQVK